MQIKKNIVTILLIIGTIVCAVIITIILINGKTETSGQKPADIKSESLACENHSTRYVFAEYDNSKTKTLKVVSNYYNGKLDSISLLYTLYYDDKTQINASESSNHADMNISFSKNGLNADALNAHYSKTEDLLKISLYATSSELNPATAKYFMIEPKNQTNLPTTINEYQENYEQQGFTCVTNE